MNELHQASHQHLPPSPILMHNKFPFVSPTRNTEEFIQDAQRIAKSLGMLIIPVNKHSDQLTVA